MAILRLLPSAIELSVDNSESILEAICRGGFTYKFGCRRGGCGICKADLVSGEVVYRKVVAETVLSAEERAQGAVLTCRAHPASNEVVLALRSGNRLKLSVPLFYSAVQREIAREKNQLNQRAE